MSGSFFNTGPFMPHGGCYLWTQSLIALHATSDALIVLAYYSIPITLFYFVKKRKDLKFHWMFVCFAVFILACGTSHLMEIWNIWHANYWLSGTIKAITALASVPTAFLLVKLIPQALALPSPEALQKAYDDMERRVQERTAEQLQTTRNLEAEIAERAQAEERLKVTLKEIGDLKAALDEHAIVAITDPRGRITYVNDKFCAISKFPREELLGQDHRIINSGFHSKDFIRDLWTTIAQGKVWKGEIKNRAKDGSFYWVDTTIVPFLNEDGKPRQYVAIRADITERKAAEEKVRESEERLRTMISSVRDYAIIMLDARGCVMDWNLGAKTIKGWRGEEIIGQHFTCFYPPEDIAAGKPERQLQQAANEGRAEDEGWRLRKDNSRFWANVVITALRNPDGQLRGFVKVTCDLTERKRAEDKLKTSLKEIGDLKAALDEHAIVAITDPQGRITYVNDKFCAISKFPREELLGQDHRIINSGFHSKDFIRDLWTTIAQGKVWKGEIKNRAKDGSFYWVDTTIVPFLNEDGKPRQYVAIRADVTERKVAEEKVRQLNVELEQRVAERTAELEAFSYSVSHDLRAPVRAIGGFARMVQEDYGRQIPPEANRKLGRIHENAMLMGQLIDGLLTFSRLGRQPLNRCKVLPSTIVQRILEEFQAEQTGRRINILTTDLPACQADPTLLQQVYANLISNAFKYTRQRDPAKIEIGWRNEKGRCVYFVKDNGAGFEMEYAHKLFGVFQRLHGPEQFEGTGVGLAIVQRIVHRHGGRVWAEAEPEKGATFSFTLGN